jgi:biotin operon repressor
VRWVDEAVANLPPEPEVLVTNLLRRGEVTVLGAPRAIGKTWASLNLAAICAKGEGELFGSPLFRATTPAKVLYLQGELGEWGSASRWALLDAGVPEGTIAEAFERVRIRTTVRRVTSTSEGTTYSDEHTEAVVDPRIEETIRAVGADVVIVDPWATFFAGNENSNDETEAAIVALIDIARRTSTAIWIVHHITAKATHGGLAEPEDLWRGASRLADAVSTRVTVLPHYSPSEAKEMGMDRLAARRYVDIFVLERNGPPVGTQHAQRDGFWWSAWEGGDRDGGRPSKLSQKQVCDAIRRAGGEVGSKTELADILEVSRKALEKVLDSLVSLGAVKQTPGERGKVGYRLTGVDLP